jgi:hypothetical protein
LQSTFNICNSDLRAETRARPRVSAMTSFPGRGPPPAAAPHLAPADVADARALRDAGGALLPGGDGVTVAGWDIRTRRTPILGKEALAGLEARLGTPHLPEMVYGSVLELTHAASDTRVHFNAEDALREWLEEDLPPLKVAAAAKWAEAHKLRFGGGLPPSKAAGAGAPVPLGRVGHERGLLRVRLDVHHAVPGQRGDSLRETHRMARGKNVGRRRPDASTAKR